MSTIASVELAAEEFALGRSLAEVPHAEFEVVRVVAHDGDSLVPYVRVTADSFEGFDAALESDSSVAEATLLDDFGDERLYRMEWVEDVFALTHVLVRAGGAVMEMFGGGDRWRLRLLLPDREALSETADYCRERDLTFEVLNIHDLSGSVSRGQFGLSKAQYEVLVAAAERGYFDVPRDVTMADLAECLDVSQQAISERLRRGHSNLIDSTIHVGGESVDDSDDEE
jgi:predicted DNA binding protein